MNTAFNMFSQVQKRGELLLKKSENVNDGLNIVQGASDHNAGADLLSVALAAIFTSVLIVVGLDNILHSDSEDRTTTPPPEPTA